MDVKNFKQMSRQFYQFFVRKCFQSFFLEMFAILGARNFLCILFFLFTHVTVNRTQGVTKNETNNIIFSVLTNYQSLIKDAILRHLKIAVSTNN